MFGALLTDLSKVFNCFDHQLLIAKRNAYGFSLPALKLVHNDLSHRQQRTEVNESYNSWLEIVFGVLKAQYLDHLRDNIIFFVRHILSCIFSISLMQHKTFRSTF